VPMDWESGSVLAQPCASGWEKQVNNRPGSFNLASNLLRTEPLCAP